MSRIFDALLRLMPQASDDSDGSWRKTRSIPLTRWHYAQAAISLTVTAALAITIASVWPATEHSVVSLAAKAVAGLADNPRLARSIETFAFVMFVGLLFTKIGRVGLADAAMREEIEFRAGAEHWTTRQRLTSSLLFGVVHLLNLVVPLSAVLGLSTGGFVFMRVYLREHRRSGSRTSALQQSAAVHCAHNRLVLRVVIPAIVLLVVVVTALGGEVRWG
jgi:hypothetical protein